MGRTKTLSKPKYEGPPVPVDPDDFAMTPEESQAFHAEMDALYRQRSEPDSALSIAEDSALSIAEDYAWRTLSRAQVDRAYRVSLSLGSWNPVSSLSLCREILRLHDVLSAISLSLECGDAASALALARPEAGEEWGEPLDTGPEPEHDGGSGQTDDRTDEATTVVASSVPTNGDGEHAS